MADIYTMDNPTCLIGTTQMKSLTSTMSLSAEDKFVSIETFANPGGEKPTTTTWTAKFTVVQSYGTDGSWNVLRAMAKTTQTFVMKPNDAATAVTNPSATFTGYIPSISFMDGGIGEVTEIDFEVKIIGSPVFATV